MSDSIDTSSHGTCCDALQHRQQARVIVCEVAVDACKSMISIIEIPERRTKLSLAVDAYERTIGKREWAHASIVAINLSRILGLNLSDPIDYDSMAQSQ
ncbi:hypothetical protein NPIL_589361 [Nephila pilipes]|uniref:Uncharacterized protein n=1 Tax=Nephila pilipes TaxID=299642 RepID=A0A8X6TVX8_NEPPI|nr:hypothetical protein NPIL_589361 [Nephila pilipes]